MCLRSNGNWKGQVSVSLIPMGQPFLHRLLENPVVFELQQRLCNNYSAILGEFSDILGQGGRRIIDIGCSTGACASSVIDMRMNNYVGIDIEPRYIEAAASRSPRGSFYVMDARKMPFPDGSFDLAMFIGVMHHMDNELVKDCLREVQRVLKSDGRVIVAEPVFTRGRWLSTLLLKLDRGRNIRDEPHYRALFEGFAIERQRFFDFSIHRFCSFVLKLSAPANVSERGRIVDA
jgi:SAM-dependent methyltransferase